MNLHICYLVLVYLEDLRMTCSESKKNRIVWPICASDQDSIVLQSVHVGKKDTHGTHAKIINMAPGLKHRQGTQLTHTILRKRTWESWPRGFKAHMYSRMANCALQFSYVTWFSPQANVKSGSMRAKSFYGLTAWRRANEDTWHVELSRKRLNDCRALIQHRGLAWVSLSKWLIQNKTVRESYFPTQCMQLFLIKS